MATPRINSRSVLYYALHALLIVAGIAVNSIGGGFWTAIGTGLIGTGVAGGVIYVYIARTDLVSARLQSLQESGIEQVYGHRAAQIRAEYDTRLLRARNQIDIVGFGLKDFRRDYLPQFGSISANASLRILLLDPASPYAAQRDTEESQSAGTIEGEVREFLRQYKATYSQLANFNDGRINVRLHRALPTVNIFRIDDDLFWGPYLMGRASGNTVTVRVRRGGLMFDQLSHHFEALWSSPQTIEPPWNAI